jgi:hypothetical protein
MEQKKVANYITRNNKELYVKLTKKKGRLKYERICLHCHRDFISVRKTALYCSDGCRVNEFKRQKKERDRALWISMQKERMIKR